MNKILISSLIIFLANIALCQNKTNDLWTKYYKKATVATFYSATILNGYDELRLAKLFTDSAEKFTYGIPERIQLIKNLKAELALSKSIASDNFNYIFPASSLMTGQRGEFIYIDDANVLLIEDLVEKMLDMPDPLNKGKFRENTNFVLTTMSPYNEEMVMVVADYLGAHTGHYCIRQHEIQSILGKDALSRYKKNNLTNADFDSICAYYHIDKFTNLNIIDNGAEIPDLCYKGIYYNNYQKEKGLSFTNYFEAFKVDKSAANSRATLVALINLVLGFLGLFLINTATFVNEGRGLKIGKYKLRFAFNTESIRDAVLIIIISFISIAGAYYLSLTIAPEINAYYKELSVKIWVAYQIVVPTLLSVAISYLALFKFPKLVINSAMGYARILYASLLMPLTLLSYFEYKAELFPELLFKYLDLVPFITLLWVVLVLGNLLNGVVKGSTPNFGGWFVIIISFFAIFIGYFLELRQSFFYANCCYWAIGGISIVLLYIDKNLSFLKTSQIRSSNYSNENESNLSNPYTYFNKGYNEDFLMKITYEFLETESEIRNIMFLGGKPGMGKTRLVREIINKIRQDGNNNVAVFSGDCNIVKDGAAPLYEPFYEAFCINGEYCCTDLDENLKYLNNKFFTNRTQIGQGISSVLSLAGNVAPVDLSNMLAIEEDSTRSVKEIVTELTDILIEKLVKHNHPKSVLFIIDDFQNVDDSSHELFIELIRTIKLRTKYTKYFKFLIIHSIQNDEITEDSPIKKLIKELIKDDNTIPEHELFLDDQIEINQKEFVHNLINTKSFKISENDKGYFSFGPLLKGHLEYLSSSLPNQLTPGDLFAYLETLELHKILTFDGNTIRIIREPEEGELKIQGSRRGIIETKFAELEQDDKKLLESASIIGFKFDAELLAQIWNKDLIEILNRLEKFEGQYVIDQSNEDNVFAFIDKVTHDVIFELAQNGKADIKQLVIEYQKRIIRSIIDSNDDQYVSRIDVDILVGATERCFKYTYIKEINSYTTILGYEAVLKLAILGKRKKALSLFSRLLEFSNRSYSEMDFYKISKILFEFSKITKSIEDFDWQINNFNFLDDLQAQSKQKANKFIVENDHLSNPYLLISIVILGGLMDKIQQKNKELFVNNDTKVKNEKLRSYAISDLLDDEDFPLYRRRYEILNEIGQENEIIDDWSNQRMLFYKIIIDGNESQELPILLKSTIAAKNYDLSTEIATYYATLEGITNVQKKNALILSLQLFRRENNLENLSLDNISDLNPSEIVGQIHHILKNQSLNSDEAKNFNQLLSNILNYMFKDCGDFEMTLELSELSVSLSNKLNDENNAQLALSYKGASLYKLGKHDESIVVFKYLFEMLIRSTRDIQKFVYAIEGLLVNGKALNDLSEFYSAKEELYEHLMYLGSAALNEKLALSLFDSEKKLSDLLEEKNTNYNNVTTSEAIDEIQQQTITDVLRILTGITYADGIVEEEELFDLRESAIALSYALNLSKNQVINQIKDTCELYENLNPQDRISLFQQTCKNLKNSQTKSFALTILSLCINMAKADGEFSLEEKNLVRIAKKEFEA